MKRVDIKLQKKSGKKAKLDAAGVTTWNIDINTLVNVQMENIALVMSIFCSLKRWSFTFRRKVILVFVSRILVRSFCQFECQYNILIWPFLNNIKYLFCHFGAEYINGNWNVTRVNKTEEINSKENDVSWKWEPLLECFRLRQTTTENKIARTLLFEVC